MEAVKQGAAAVGLKVYKTFIASLVCYSTTCHFGGHCSYRSLFLTEVLLLNLQSDAHVILASLKRAPSELSSHTQKVFKIDDHLGIATAGLAADGRVLCRYMRNECINHRYMAECASIKLLELRYCCGRWRSPATTVMCRRYVYESSMPVGRLVRQIADKGQVATQRSWKRPYGVGLLVSWTLVLASFRL